MEKNNDKILLGAHMSIAGGFYNAAIRGRSIGCTAIQIFTKSNRQWEANPIAQSDAEQFKEQVKKSNILEVVAHASYLINVGSQSQKTRERSSEALKVELDRCHTLGIKKLVLHPGSRKEMSEEESLKHIAQNVDWAIDNSNGDTVVLLETMAGQGSSVGHTFEQLATIMDLSKNKDRIGVCFDTCHAFAAGYNIRKPEKHTVVWQEFDRIIGLDKLKLIHLNDSKKNLNSRIDRHEHIGEGEIGIIAFKSIMNDPRLVHIPKILETPKKDETKEDIANIKALVGLLARNNKRKLIDSNLAQYL